MNKIVTTKKTSAIFLAIVLVAGTIALSSPSFMVGAQAVPEYGMEKKYSSYEESEYGMDSYDKKAYGKDDSYKSKDSNSVIVKKVKCNNVNVNVNGLDLNLTSVPFLSNLLASEAHASDEGERGANSYGSNGGGSYGDKKSDSDNFKFVCINNNNNTVVVLPPPVPTVPPVPETCEECFTTVIPDEEELDDLIQAFEVDSEGFIGSLQDLCDFITEEVQQVQMGEQLDLAFVSDRLFVLGGQVGITEDRINEILDCLEEVFGGDFPREIIEEPLTTQQMKWKS